MTGSTKRFAWINIWMMASSAAGIWLVYPSMYQHDVYWAFEAIIPLAVVFLVGLSRMPLSFHYGTGAGGRPTLEDTARLYLDALRHVFRQRWILWLFGSILALTLLAGCINTWLEYARYSGEFTASGERAWRLWIPAGYADWMFMLPHQLLSAVSISLGRFLPSSGIGADGIAAMLTPLILLVLVIWIGRRLSALRDEPDPGGQVELIRAALVPLALIAAVFIVFLVLEGRAMSSPSLRGEWPDTGLLVASMAGSGIAIVLHALFTGTLVAGIGGSLLRVKRGESVTADSFRQDVVRYVLPVAGVYLLLAGVRVLLYLGEGIPAMMAFYRNNHEAGWTDIAGRSVREFLDLLYILAMFAPFAVILRESGAWQGIKDSLREWSAHKVDAVSFAALGMSFMSLALTVGNLLSAVARGHSVAEYMTFAMPPMIFQMLSTAISAIFRVLVAAVMAVAVWEFYWRISRSSERA